MQDVPLELSRLFMTEVDKEGLPPGYKFVGDGAVQNEWDATAEVKKSEREEKRHRRGWTEEGSLEKWRYIRLRQRE